MIEHFSNTDFFLELLKGNVEGHAGIFIQGANPSIGLTYEDICDFGGVQVLPTSAETLEVVSTDANDTSAGTGMRTATLLSLDANYVRQTTTVTMNGTTPVVLDNTHLRTTIIFAATAGSSGNNEGTVTLRVSGGGATRQQMSIDEGSSFCSSYTVPAGKTSVLYKFNVFAPKGEDVTVRPVITALNAASISGVPIEVYQNSAELQFVANVTLQPKTDVTFQAKSTNTGVRVSSLYQYIEVDV